VRVVLAGGLAQGRVAVPRARPVAEIREVEDGISRNRRRSMIYCLGLGRRRRDFSAASATRGQDEKHEGPPNPLHGSPLTGSAPYSPVARIPPGCRKIGISNP